jgi:hypothetical protein
MMLVTVSLVLGMVTAVPDSVSMRNSGDSGDSGGSSLVAGWGGDAQFERQVSRVAFGSCNKPSRKQPLWETILATRPEVWLWTGDAVYTNGSDLPDLTAAYALQWENREYSKFLSESKVRVMGAIDDHDYGVNDAVNRTLI